jgi:hypothetical protein
VRRRLRGERGIALSGPTALLSAAAVALAGVAFVATNSSRTQAEAAPTAPGARVTVTATPAPSPSATRTPQRRPAKKKPVKRGDTLVEVFNNSGIGGLAGSTAARAQGAGWQVVGSDNWYGTIPASTIYSPARLRAAAALLGKDLGISRVKPLIAPMRGDRLTVILTRDYS